MAKLHPQDTWNPQVLESHPLFWPLVSGASAFVESFSDWPTLEDFQHYLDSSDKPINTRSHLPLTIVPQDENPVQFSDGYEPRIYLKGELQTRQNSWHDFFQVLVWKIFPKTKAAINELHFNAIKERIQSTYNQKRRSVFENLLTQFDECGGIVISPDTDLLQLVNNFDWKTLFWEKRTQTTQRLKCIVFGHAIYEKAVNPYIGMTSHCVLLTVPEKEFSAANEILVEYLDTRLESHFSGNTGIQSPRELSPFPLLGLPGWHCNNTQENFYKNEDYFRPGRKQQN